MFKIGFFQFNPQFGKIGSNLTKVISALNRVQTDIIVLPELPFTGYFFKNRDELKGMTVKRPCLRARSRIRSFP